MQSAEIGLFSMSVDGRTFNLIPNLKNVAKIADKVRILLIYEMIHSPKVPDWYRLDIARDIILACSDSPDIDKHLIRSCRQMPYVNKHKISINDQVMLAAALMRHGVAGVNRDKATVNGKTPKAATEFDVNKIVSYATVVLKMSTSDALNLTMSEFCYRWAAKYPKETKQSDAPSMDAHKRVMKALMEKNKNGK